MNSQWMQDFGIHKSPLFKERQRTRVIDNPRIAKIRSSEQMKKIYKFIMPLLKTTENDKQIYDALCKSGLLKRADGLPTPWRTVYSMITRAKIKANFTRIKEPSMTSIIVGLLKEGMNNQQIMSQVTTSRVYINYVRHQIKTGKLYQRKNRNGISK